jgi:hypothetical protein
MNDSTEREVSTEKSCSRLDKLNKRNMNETVEEQERNININTRNGVYGTYQIEQTFFPYLFISNTVKKTSCKEHELVGQV